MGDGSTRESGLVPIDEIRANASYFRTTLDTARNSIFRSFADVIRTLALVGVRVIFFISRFFVCFTLNVPP